jgi:hypothetical protein
MPIQRVGFALACLLAWTTSPATADVIYQYTGNPFTTVASPYTTSDFISGTIELSSILPPNLNQASIQVNAFSFSDGVQTLTSATLGSPTDSLVSTDGSGAIVAFWEFVFGGSNPEASSIQTLNAFPGMQGPVTKDEGRLGNLAMGEPIGANTNSPGVWTLVPEPSTTLLLASGVVCLAVRRRHARGASLGERGSA